MSWANNVLPRFIGVSGESKARRLPHRKFAIQIGDIKKPPNAAPAMGSKLMACILTGHN